MKIVYTAAEFLSSTDLIIEIMSRTPIGSSKNVIKFKENVRKLEELISFLQDPVGIQTHAFHVNKINDLLRVDETGGVSLEAELVVKLDNTASVNIVFVIDEYMIVETNKVLKEEVGVLVGLAMTFYGLACTFKSAMATLAKRLEEIKPAK